MFTDEMLDEAGPSPAVYARAERTKLKYPTVAPDGSSWKDYFRSIRRVADETEEEEEPAETIVVTKPAEWVDKGWPRAISPYVKLLEQNGWAWKVGHSQAIKAAVLFKDPTQGIRFPERELDVWWFDAVRDGIRIRGSWTYSQGKPMAGWGGLTSSEKLGLYSSTEFKELICE